jgi:hypothetical protein
VISADSTRRRPRAAAPLRSSLDRGTCLRICAQAATMLGTEFTVSTVATALLIQGSTGPGDGVTLTGGVLTPEQRDQLFAAGIETITDTSGTYATVSISDAAVTEPADPGSSIPKVYATFTVTLSTPLSQAVTVDYATADGSGPSGAIDGLDYVATSGTLTFDPGVTSQTVQVEILGDNIDEGTENFDLNLSAPTNATIVDGLGIATILDGDHAPTAPATNSVSVDENTTSPPVPIFASDLDGDTLTYAVKTGSEPGKGTISFIGDSFVYAPYANLNGADTFTIVVSDGHGGSAEQTVSVNINPLFTEGDDTVTLPLAGGTFDALGGNDAVRYGGGFVALEGGAGTDTFDFSLFGSAVWVDLTRTAVGDSEAWTRDGADVNSGTWRALADVTNVENLVGTAYSDRLYGDASDNTFSYNGGFDILEGRGGTDTADFSLFASAVYVDLARTGSGDNEAWTRDRADVSSGTWRAIANLDAIENVTGTAHADKLYGNDSANRLDGGAGDDALTGRGGDDVLDGGDGSDTAVFANAIASYTFALVGSDIVVTGEGSDTVLDTVEQFQFSDMTLARAQLLDEIAMADYVWTPGNDSVALPIFGDTCDALAGDDTVSYRGGLLSVDGNIGNDTVDFSASGSAVWVDLTRTGSEDHEAWTRDRADVDPGPGTWRAIAHLANVENLVGTVHSDRLYGDANDNTFSYNEGFDILDGRGGTDTADFSLFGSAVYVDLARTGSGDNEAWTRDRADVNPGPGTWRAIANLDAIENVTGTAQADRLLGNDGVNRLEGGAGNDTLTGRGGNDLFVFGAGFGADTITDFAGAGAAVGDRIALSVGPDFDTFSEVNDVASVVGGNTVLDFGGGNTITLTGVTTALHENDFLFV